MMPQAHRISRKFTLAAALLIGVVGCAGLPGAHAGVLHGGDLPAHGKGFSFGPQGNFATHDPQGGDFSANHDPNGNWKDDGPGNSGWHWNGDGPGHWGADGDGQNGGQNGGGWDFDQHSHWGHTSGSVPEPGSLALFGAALGLLGAAMIARRRSTR